MTYPQGLSDNLLTFSTIVLKIHLNRLGIGRNWKDYRKIPFSFRNCKKFALKIARFL